MAVGSGGEGPGLLSVAVDDGSEYTGEDSLFILEDSTISGMTGVPALLSIGLGAN